MNNRGLLVFLASIFVLLVFGSFFVFAFFNSGLQENESHIDNGSEKISCDLNSDCGDDDSCTLDYCGDANFCINTKVVLCYHDDGCCPQGCTLQNDNDCRE